MTAARNHVSDIQQTRITQYKRANAESRNSLDTYDFVSVLDRFRHRESGTLLTERVLLRLHGSNVPGRMTYEEALYTIELGIRQYASLTFVPGSDENVSKDGQLNLNTWQRPDLVVAEGDAGRFFELVRLIFDDDEIAVNFFLDAIASLLQRPERKWAFMILIVGGQGIGKSILCDMVAELVGRQNTAFPTPETIKGQFTGWMLNAHVVIFHELERINRDVAARIKHWITSDTLLVNTKNVPEFYIRNYVNILACSNHDDVAHLDEDDRRMFTWSSKAAKQAPAFYQDLCQWYFGGPGKGIVYGLLLQRDISEFNPNAAPPKTGGRERLIQNSRSEAENFLRNELESGSPPFVTDLCTANEILLYLRVHQIRCSDAAVRIFLAAVGALSLGQRRVRGQRLNLWAVRNHEHWQSASHDAIASEYVSVFDQGALLMDRQASERMQTAPMPKRRQSGPPLAE